MVKEIGIQKKYAREEIVEELTKNYEKIGDITPEEFLAIKKELGHKIYKVECANPDSIKKVTENGELKKISPEDIEKGDTIKITATIGSGNKQKTGNITIENIIDAKFDPETGYLLIDSDKYALTNINYEQSARDLGHLIVSPETWVTKEAMEQIGLGSATYSDVEVAHQIQEQKREVREKEAELNMSDLNNISEYEEIQNPSMAFLFNEEIDEEQQEHTDNSINTIDNQNADTPELMF